MSKTSIKNKEAKAKNKVKNIDNRPTEASASKIPNAGKCCTCRYFPAHFRGEAQQCKVLKAYVARKAEHPCWKAK